MRAAWSPPCSSSGLGRRWAEYRRCLEACGHHNRSAPVADVTLPMFSRLMIFTKRHYSMLFVQGFAPSHSLAITHRPELGRVYAPFTGTQDLSTKRFHNHVHTNGRKGSSVCQGKFTLPVRQEETHSGSSRTGAISGQQPWIVLSDPSGDRGLTST